MVIEEAAITLTMFVENLQVVDVEEVEAMAFTTLKEVFTIFQEEEVVASRMLQIWEYCMFDPMLSQI